MKNPNPTEKQIREAIKKSNDEQYETFHGHKRPTPPVESWEKEFDEKFTHTLQDDDEKIINWTTDSADIKQFISSQIQQAEERGYKQGKIDGIESCNMKIFAIDTKKFILKEEK